MGNSHEIHIFTTSFCGKGTASGKHYNKKVKLLYLFTGPVKAKVRTEQLQLQEPSREPRTETVKSCSWDIRDRQRALPGYSGNCIQRATAGIQRKPQTEGLYLSRAGWMGFWSTWSRGRCPCPRSERNWEGFTVLPTQTTLWCCDLCPNLQ